MGREKRRLTFQVERVVGTELDIVVLVRHRPVDLQCGGRVSRILRGSG